MKANVIAASTLYLFMVNAWADSYAPEPESITLLIAGAGAFGLLRWLRQRK